MPLSFRAHGSAHHSGDLHMVAAGVGRTGHRVCTAVARGNDGVQLTHQGQLHVGISAFHGRDDAGDGHIVLVGNAQLIQHFFHFGAGFKFFVTQFRLGENGFAHGDDLFRIAVYRFASTAFQFVYIHWNHPFFTKNNGSALTLMKRCGTRPHRRAEDGRSL